MRRRLLNAGVILSLLLCMGTVGVGLWGAVRPVSGWRYVRLADADVGFEAAHGSLTLTATLWNRPQLLPVVTDPPGAMPGGSATLSIRFPDGPGTVDVRRLDFTPTPARRWGGIAWEQGHSTHPPGALLREAEGLPRPPPALVQWHRVAVPLAYPGALFAVLPLVLGWRRLRERRRRSRADNGLCVDCGYDLRSSPGRCPECGRPAAAIES